MFDLNSSNSKGLAFGLRRVMTLCVLCSGTGTTEAVRRKKPLSVPHVEDVLSIKDFADESPQESRDHAKATKLPKRSTGKASKKKTPKDRNFEDLCLTSPVDKYRTCFQRASDPANDLVEDKILRNEYNMGKIQPYTPPYVSPDEKLTYGTIYISTVQNDNKELSCKDQRDLEGVTLQWLKDNVGGPESFTPVCAFNDGYALYSANATRMDGTRYVIETESFKIDLVFATKKKWVPESSELLFHRRLECDQSIQQECCSADEINFSSKEERRENKQFCRDNGCGKCPKNRNNDDLHSHSLTQGDLNGTDFNAVLGDKTSLNPISSGALVNGTGLDQVALCRANTYHLQGNIEPILSCATYDDNSCRINCFIDPDSYGYQQVCNPSLT